MVGNSVVVINSATQTSDIESSDNEDPYDIPPNASPLIDTSQPFESVEEAVIRFGGRGFWIPGSFLPDDPPTDIDPNQDESEESEVTKLEKRAAEMLKQLQSKDEETREILQELNLTKRLLEELKLTLPKESSKIECNSVKKDDSVDCIGNNREPTEIIMNELKQTKLNLYQNTNELASIRACVESLSKKIDSEKISVAKSAVNPLAITRELRELNYEADEFMKSAEAAKSEVLRAMSEIDQRKTGLKVIEPRWMTAKKLESAARAAESLALAEIRALSNNERISLSLEEYSALTDKARQNSRLLDSSDFEFMRDECRSTKKRPTTSIGDILRRKLVMKDDIEVGRREESRERVSLNQMSRRHREDKDVGGGGEESSKGLFGRRSRLGLVHISFPLSKHGKNKIQALNLW